MLQRVVNTGRGARWFVAAAGLFLVHCGVAPEGESPANARQAIIGGAVSDVSDSPTLLLHGAEGDCSAVLVAPTLALTARHCIAQSKSGTFACTAQGELIPNGSGTGTIGANDPPSMLKFYTWGGFMSGTYANNTPEALGTQIISTNTPTSCRDDLAFVVLDRVLPNIVPLPMRLDRVTMVGESITLMGYGYTNGLDPLALRVVNAQVQAVGPDTPPTTAQPAPVRAVKTGPVTCVGDSGGPFVGADGTIVAVVSLGTQNSDIGPFCDTTAQPTLGPRLAAYKALATQALAAVGISTSDDAGAEGGDDSASGDDGSVPDSDAGMPADDASTTEDDAAVVDDAGEMPPMPPEEAPPDDSGCSMGAVAISRSHPWVFAAAALALTAAARKRRRRNGSSS